MQKRTLWRIRQRLLPNLGVGAPDSGGQHPIFLLKNNALLAKIGLAHLELTSYLQLYPEPDDMVAPLDAVDQLAENFVLAPDPKWEKRGYTLLPEQAWCIHHKSNADLKFELGLDFYLPMQKRCDSMEEVVQEVYRLLEDVRFYRVDYRGD